MVVEMNTTRNFIFMAILSLLLVQYSMPLRISRLVQAACISQPPTPSTDDPDNATEQQPFSVVEPSAEYSLNGTLFNTTSAKFSFGDETISNIEGSAGLGNIFRCAEEPTAVADDAIDSAENAEIVDRGVEKESKSGDDDDVAASKEQRQQREEIKNHNQNYDQSVNENVNQNANNERFQEEESRRERAIKALHQYQVDLEEKFNKEKHIADLITKYKGKFLCCSSPLYPHCDIYLCGTLHVAASSAEMVKEVVNALAPNFVVLELCEARVDNLYDVDEPAANISLPEVMKSSWNDRSLKTFGMGLLAWMQLKAAKVMGNKLGGELAAAAKEGYKHRATIVLGDRLYGVTIQRVFDKLTVYEKLKMVVIILWEVLTMSLFKIKDYIHKTENDEEFIKDEIQRFGKHLPGFANVIINERDEYLAQTLCEIARIGFGNIANPPPGLASHAGGFHKLFPKGKILAVVGAGHLAGIQKHVDKGGSTVDRLAEISSSSKHASTWPSAGMLHIVNGEALFGPQLSPLPPLTSDAPAVVADPSPSSSIASSSSTSSTSS